MLREGGSIVRAKRRREEEGIEVGRLLGWWW